MEHQHPILSSRIAGKGNNYSNNDRLCSRIGLTESSNMLHYSNASSRGQNRQYLVIKGGAFVVALARRRGRQLRSRTGQQQRQSRSLPERRGGRNNEYNVNRCISMHDMTSNDARRALMWYQVILVKGGNIRESIPGVSRFRTDELEGESCMFAMLGMCGG